MDEIDSIFLALRHVPGISPPLIACLYTGALPDCCSPMPRLPAPPTGTRLDNTFADHVLWALARNPAVHDGAVMLGRETALEAYSVVGWSYRLFPPPLLEEGEPNRGSAFNSCLAMSAVARVDRLYLVSRGVLSVFRGGGVREIADLPDQP